MIRATSTPDPHQIHFTNGAHAAVADLPAAKGGAGRGFGPHDLLEAALATCVSMTARMVAADRGFPLSGATCEVRIDRSVPGPVALDYRLTLDGPLTADQERQVRDAVARCPVAATLRSGVTIRAATEG